MLTERNGAINSDQVSFYEFFKAEKFIKLIQRFKLNEWGLGRKSFLVNDFPLWDSSSSSEPLFVTYLVTDRQYNGGFE